MEKFCVCAFFHSLCLVMYVHFSALTIWVAKIYLSKEDIIRWSPELAGNKLSWIMKMEKKMVVLCLHMITGAPFSWWWYHLAVCCHLHVTCSWKTRLLLMILLCFKRTKQTKNACYANAHRHAQQQNKMGTMVWQSCSTSEGRRLAVDFAKLAFCPDFDLEARNTYRHLYTLYYGQAKIEFSRADRYLYLTGPSLNEK